MIASSLGKGLGSKVADPRLATLSEGLHEVGKQLVVSGDVPSAGWRVVFTQKRSEFVAPLAGPLQSVGLVLVLLLLAIGLMLTITLARRLRESREQEQRLRELNRSQDEFISVVSHELRTPVSGVLGFLQTSLDHWDAMSDEDRHNAVRRAFTNARRLQAMTRDVLDTESIESDHFGYIRHPFDLVEEVRTAADGFGGTPRREPRAHGPRGSRRRWTGTPTASSRCWPTCSTTRARTPLPTAPIEITLEHDDRVARLVVKDHGAGIDPDQVERIFEKFVRGRADSVSGTGLGLYISRRIVEAHEGRIWAESRPGQPTRFVVELPCQTLVTT